MKEIPDICFYQRKNNGRWTAQFDFGRDPKTGSRIREYYHGGTKREVKEKANKKLAEIHKGQYIYGDNMKLKEWLHTWLDGRKNAIAYKTHKEYKSNIRNHIDPEIDEYNLEDLNTRIIQQLINDKYGNGRIRGSGGLSRRSVKYIYQTLNTALKQAVKEKLITHNPVKAVELPKSKGNTRYKIEPLTKYQANKLLKTAQDSNLFISYFLSLHTGMRKAELLGLKWTDVDENNKTIEVNRQVQRITGKGLNIKGLNSDSSYRTIPINQNVINKLIIHRKKQKENKIFYGSDYIDRNLIISKENGDFITPEKIYKEFKTLLKKAELPDIRLHDLRHTYATLSLQEGVPAKVIQKTLGHASIQTNLDIYSHVTEQMYQEAADKIGNVIG